MASHGAIAYREGMLTHSQFLTFIAKIDNWKAAKEVLLQYDSQPPRTAVASFHTASKDMASAICECMQAQQGTLHCRYLSNAQAASSWSSLVLMSFKGCCLPCRQCACEISICLPAI